LGRRSDAVQDSIGKRPGVWPFSGASETLSQARGTGDGEFNLVHDVAIDKQGRVYVADRTNARVQVFDQSGKFLAKWTNVGAPWGLYYVARENAIYMCDGVNNRVIKLNLDGQVLGVLGSYGKTPGKFDFAHNLTVDSTGAIYVAEIKNWRVQKFAKP
jgi:DNA-binding beta-propeller fold protein YncE